MNKYSEGKNDINLENDFMSVYLTTLNEIFKGNRQDMLFLILLFFHLIYFSNIHL